MSTTCVPICSPSFREAQSYLLWIKLQRTEVTPHQHLCESSSQMVSYADTVAFLSLKYASGYVISEVQHHI